MLGEEVMMMILIVQMMDMALGIMVRIIMLRKKVQNPLGEPLVVVNLQAEILSFLEGMQHQVITLEDMIPGNILPILTFLDILEVMGMMEVLHQDTLALIGIQETGFHSIFLTLILDPSHHHFLNSLA